MNGLHFWGPDDLFILKGVGDPQHRALLSRLNSGPGMWDYLVLTMTFPAGIAAMGALLGAAFPLTRRLALAIPIGVVAALPIVGGIALASNNALTHWTFYDSVAVVVSARC